MKILLLVYTERRKLSMHLEKQLKAAIFSCRQLILVEKYAIMRGMK